MEDFWGIYKEYMVERSVYSNVLIAHKRLIEFLSRIKIHATIQIRQIAIQDHYEYAIINISWNDKNNSFSANLMVVVEKDMKADYLLEKFILQLEQSLISKGKEGIYYQWLEESVMDMLKSEHENGAN